MSICKDQGYMSKSTFQSPTLLKIDRKSKTDVKTIRLLFIIFPNFNFRPRRTHGADQHQPRAYRGRKVKMGSECAGPIFITP